MKPMKAPNGKWTVVSWSFPWKGKRKLIHHLVMFNTRKEALNYIEEYTEFQRKQLEETMWDEMKESIVGFEGSRD